MLCRPVAEDDDVIIVAAPDPQVGGRERGPIAACWK